MIECKVDRDSIKQAIERSVLDMAMNTGKFSQITPVSLSPIKSIEDARDSITNINSQWQDMVMKVEGDTIHIAATEELINQGLRQANKNEVNDRTVKSTEAKNRPFWDEAAVMAEIGLKPGDNLKDFTNRFSPEGEQIAKFMKANPWLKMAFGNNSQYDPVTNEVTISLLQAYVVSLGSDMSMKQVLNGMIIHEMSHAAIDYALDNPKNFDVAHGFYQQVLDFHKTTPFEDKLRQGYVLDDGLPYPFMNVGEFIAEAFGNPYFQEYLKGIPGKPNMWERIVNWIRNFIGLKPIETEDIYHKVINFVNSEKIQRDNTEGLIQAETLENGDKKFSYNGNPKDYIDARYEYFTTESIHQQVDPLFKELPSAIVRLKKIAEVSADKTQLKAINSLLGAYNDVKDNKGTIAVYVNMLVTSAKIAKDLENQLFEAAKMPDDIAKVGALMSLLNASHSLGFISPLINDILFIMRKEGYNNNLKEFVNDLDRVNSIENSIKRNFIKTTTPLIEKYFISLFPENEPARKIRENIEKLRTNLSQSEIDPKDKAKWAEMIKREEKKLTMMPTPETFSKIFAGKYEDASSIQMWVESAALNRHPLVGATFDYLMRLDEQVGKLMLVKENDHQRHFDPVEKKLKLNMTDPSKTWRVITDVVADVVSVSEDENGKIIPVTMKRKMFTSPYLATYLEEQFMFRETRDFFYGKYLEGRREGDDTKADRYYSLYEDVIGKKLAWEKENSERKYKDEVYDMFALLDQKITYTDDNGKEVTTSFRKERGNIFRQIEQLEHVRDSSSSFSEQEDAQNEIRQRNIELKEIRSAWDKDGILKTGMERELSIVADKYYDMRYRLGKAVLTDEGKASFEREKLRLSTERDRGNLTKEQYEAAMNDITVTDISDEYYNEIKRFSGIIADATAKMMSIEGIGNVVGNVNKDYIRNGYEKIKELTKTFRDRDGVIDGILFSKIKPDLVVQIRDIQQELENLKNIASKLKGLSVEDAITYNKLYPRSHDGTLTPDETQQFNELQAKKNKTKTNYKKNKKLIDGYYEALSGLSALMDTTVSDYYLQEKDTQLNELTVQQRNVVREEVVNNNTIENGLYYKSGGRWMKALSINPETGQRTVHVVDGDDNYTAEDKIVDEIAASRAKQMLEESKWWKENHFTAYTYDKENKAYVPEERAIYIWVKTSPINKQYVLEDQASFKFKTYKVNDDMINPDHNEILPYIPINKKDKYVNPNYIKLQKENPTMFGYMEFLRKEFKDAQKFYPDEKKLGDLFPGIPLTKGERMVNTVRKLFDSSTYRNLFEAGALEDVNEDTQMLLGGSQSKFYTNARILPTRFTGRISEEKQSNDVPGMVLTFILATLKYNTLLTAQPVLEATRTIVSELGTTESVTVAKKAANIISGMWSVLAGKGESVSKEKVAEKTNLAKTMDFVMDTFMYGQTKEATVSNIGGMTIDWQKVSSNLRHMSSLSIFSLNSFVAVKNTLSAKVQGILFANYGDGTYTTSDFAWANWKAKDFIKDHFTDYKKFGDKSYIGQALKYFQVLQGTAYDAYGRKTQWTTLKNWESVLSVVKNISEFELQVTQFLAMSRANKVTLNGKKVDFLDAYEKSKEGDFKLKAGAEITEEMEHRFTRRIIQINRNINGAYRHDEMNKAQKTVIGGLMFYLNGFVVPGIISRYGSLRYSIESETFTRGSWNQAFQFGKDLLNFRRGINKEWKDLAPDEKNRVIRFLKELGFVVAFMLLVGALGGGEDKKDLAKNIALQNYMLALAMSVKSETETFTPLPSMGLNELSRKLNSPFAALKQISTILRTMQSAADYIRQSPSAFYKQTGVHDGFHDKGDAKVVANFFKLLGNSGVQFNPLERVIRGRQIQQMR